MTTLAPYRRFLAAVLAGGIAGADPGAAQEAQRHVIDIRDFAFDPPSLSVAVGDTVVWTNRDVVPHTVTIAGGGDSGAIEEEQSWEFAVMKSGRLVYGCGFHPSRAGEIDVR
ncbi:MAG: cupredoxin domain-containing protein [Dongiaceae bacterium]